MGEEQARLEQAEAAIEAAANRASRDPARPVYHLLPPAQWMNDVCGTIHHHGWYHVCYLINPFGDHVARGRLQPRRPGVAWRVTMAERRFRLTEDERQAWQRDGFFLREDVFSGEENDLLDTVAEEIVAGARAFPEAHVDRNALVRDGREQRPGIHGMHKIHFPSCYVAEFLQRVRDPRLTDPIVDLLGPDVLGINNLYIWKAPEIGLGFPWHRTCSTFASASLPRPR